jgi:predicted DNA-binding transcriptional regulator AlpA
MSNIECNNEIKLLTENEVSIIIKKSTAWLRRSRWLGDGIPYRKLGGSVRYNESDVLKWIENK